jgi:flavin-dependent dehydrogenase
MYDVIVVGARCAGSPVAMLLARQGAKVLLVDRATFPSDIPHGHFVHRHGPPRLRRWGLLDRVAERTAAITRLVSDLGDYPMHVSGLVEDGVPWAFGPRRTTLDKILVDGAVAAGAELREGFSVDEYVFDAGRMVGVRGRARDGRVVEERAVITVGADGRNSRLARAVQAPMYEDGPPVLGYYFSYWSGVETEDFELYLRPGARRIIFSFKTEGGLFCIFVGFRMEELPEFRHDIEAMFMQTVDLVPDYAARIRAGRRAERFYGASDLPNFYRKPYGPGWALVGDAGAHKDPYLALGICDAWRDGEFLATAIAEGLSGSRPMDEALAEYERRRNEASDFDYKETLSVVPLGPPDPQVLAIRAAVRDKPDEATRLVKARMGMIERTAFFNPQNLQRLLGGLPAGV